MENFLSIIIPIFFFIIGSISCGTGIHGMYQVLTSHNFCSVKGKILYSEMEINMSSPDDAISYNAKIEYEYYYNGTRYMSTNIYVGENLSTALLNFISNKTNAQQLTSTYFAGKEVTVFVDPLNPSNCYIEKRGIIGPIFYLVLGCGILYLFIQMLSK